MKTKREGFTLIELLAVLVILAVIALIAVPIILGIVEGARKDAFVRSTELVVSSTDIDMAVADYANGHTYTMTDGVIPNLKVGINNTKGMSGTITYGTDGIAEYVLHNNKWCVKKTKDMSQAEVTEYDKDTCTIDGLQPISGVSLELVSQDATTFTVKVKSEKNETFSKYEFSINEEEFIDNETNESYTYNEATGGTYSVKARVTDNHGQTYETDVLEVKITLVLIGNIKEAMENAIKNANTSIDAGDNSILKNEGDYGIRFEGTSPNNYINFNDETWRIIGIVDGKVKIIRNDSLGDMAWDDDDGDLAYDKGQDTHDWSNATLQTLLNEDYYKSTGTYADNKGIKAKYKDMIDATTTWSLLGGTTSVTKSDMYNIERTTGSVYGSNPRTLIAPIGLMYPSDYGFAVKESDQCPATKALNRYNIAECFNNDWLYNSAKQWTITPRPDSESSAFFVESDGYVNSYGSNVNYARGVRPVLNLASNVKITGGTGTIDDMYQLSL